jgi:hypothetical protein
MRAHSCDECDRERIAQGHQKSSVIASSIDMQQESVVCDMRFYHSARVPLWAIHGSHGTCVDHGVYSEPALSAVLPRSTSSGRGWRGAPLDGLVVAKSESDDACGSADTSSPDGRDCDGWEWSNMPLP